MFKPSLRMGIAVLALVAIGAVVSGGAAEACFSCAPWEPPTCLATWSGADDCEIHTKVIDPPGPGGSYPISWCDEDGFGCIHEPGGIPPV